MQQLMCDLPRFVALFLGAYTSERKGGVALYCCWLVTADLLRRACRRCLTTETSWRQSSTQGLFALLDFSHQGFKPAQPIAPALEPCLGVRVGVRVGVSFFLAHVEIDLHAIQKPSLPAVLCTFAGPSTAHRRSG